jgi:argininosuccinate lyase
MKLWQKDVEANKIVEEFTIGKDKDFDVFLAKADVLGNIAHTQMLQSIGLLTAGELTLIHKELIDIYNIIEKEQFVIEPGVEDVHSQVELMLTRKLGDVGKKVHSGRSRNDQVLVDLKLFLRSELIDTIYEIKNLFTQLISLSEKYKQILIPGYTHLQIAMPSSFGLWFGCYAESLSDDLQLLLSAYKINNQNPLGSAAGYGSSFPLNRQMTTDLLGFDNLNYNVVYAQMGRGKVEKIVSYAIASIAGTLSKMAMEVCLFMSQNFGFLTFPEELTTGSSIMPHKKNPDVFELIRGKCNRLQALPIDISFITTNLPLGYNRDLQLIKESIIPAFEEINSCMRLTQLMFDNVIINDNIVSDEKYKYIFSVEEVNKKVLQGVPFRDAYKQVGMDIKNGDYNPGCEVNHSHEGSIGNLCNDKIKNKFDCIFEQFNFEKIDLAISNLITKK